MKSDEKHLHVETVHKQFTNILKDFNYCNIMIRKLLYNILLKIKPHKMYFYTKIESKDKQKLKELKAKHAHAKEEIIKYVFQKLLITCILEIIQL